LSQRLKLLSLVCLTMRNAAICMPQSKKHGPRQEMLEALAARDARSRLNWLQILHLAQQHGAAATLAAEPQTQRTVLHVAVSEFVPEDYVGMLIARGATPSAQCCSGQTPLVLAIARGNVPAARILATFERDGRAVAQALLVAQWIEKAADGSREMTAALRLVR
jgi:Ankyrin repeats (many copies)